jgi:hypothetical protein
VVSNSAALVSVPTTSNATTAPPERLHDGLLIGERTCDHVVDPRDERRGCVTDNSNDARFRPLILTTSSTSLVVPDLVRARAINRSSATSMSLSPPAAGLGARPKDRAC